MWPIRKHKCQKKGMFVADNDAPDRDKQKNQWHKEADRKSLHSW